MTTVETGLLDPVLTEIEKFVIPRVQLAMNSVIDSSGRGVDSVALDPDQRFLQEKLKAFL